MFYARHCAKHFTHVLSFNLHNVTSCVDGETEGLSKVHGVKKSNGRAGLGIWIGLRAEFLSTDD